MVNEIKRKYGEFSDSWITDIHYSVRNVKSSEIKKKLEIIIVCFNWENDNK